MAPMKAPRSVGYHVIFFQCHWDHIGGSIYEWVKGVFKGKPIDPDLNNTLIVLIQKLLSQKKYRNLGPSAFARYCTN